MALEPDDPRHGTHNAYKNLGCRCAPCTEASRVGQRAEKARRVARGEADPSRIPHGTPGGYGNWACRCDECTAAWRATWNARHGRKQDA